MSHLLAFKTIKRTSDFVKVLTNNQIYNLPDLTQSLNYNHEYALQEGEWFKIQNFSEKDFCIDFLKIPFNSVEYNNIDKVNDLNIKFLCFVDGNYYYFQKVSPKKVIHKKYIYFDGEPRIAVNEPIIEINELPDAIYYKENDTLYFKYLTTLVTIFKGINDLYREASIGEIEAFFTNDFIHLEGEYNAHSVKIPNSKRIALAKDTLATYLPEEKTQMYSYIREYCQDLEFDDQQQFFKIGSEEHLKKILWGIEQRYFKTAIKQEKKVATAVENA